MKNNIVYLSLGSNLGDKQEYLKKAVSLLERLPEVRLIAKSSLYQTDPVGYTDQDQFLNAVIKIETTLSPGELLAKTQEIELALDRKRLIHWGPRTIDIDMLLFAEETIKEENLSVPHPEMHRRSFVLVPLAELEGDINVPGYGKVKELLAGMESEEAVFLVKGAKEW